ncbi:hypothetical protein [Rhizobium sp. C4]|uniref:hypothetical protein n=1 Tax=Rhizobium sp. C4 TaxID=1349800 RepID=UPI001E5324C7|nr:hypothetical protein [Rhizobium sp. C4]MCD2172602.1 hypothetical protein [Rhizobium sp. C4]
MNWLQGGHILRCVEQDKPEREEAGMQQGPLSSRQTKAAPSRRNRLCLLLVTLSAIVACLPQPGHAEARAHRPEAAGLSPNLIVATSRKPRPEPRQCRFNNRSFATGSTVQCSMDPNDNRGCALGLPFARWSCRDGRWVLSGSGR